MSAQIDEEELYKYAEQCLFNNKNEEAYAALNQILEKGNKKIFNAQYRLGQMYYFGDYVEKDFKKALDYFVKSNHPDAQIYLGYIYYYGQGIDKDFEKAYNCFLNASENPYDKYNKLNGNYMLGLMYFNGEFVEKNINKAKDYFSYVLKLNPNNEGANKMLLEINKENSKENEYNSKNGNPNFQEFWNTLIFSTGWKKEIEYIFFNKNFKIELKFKSFQESDLVTESQKESFINYYNNRENLYKSIENKLSQTNENSDKNYRPTMLLIQKNGETAVLFDDNNNPDEGICCVLKDEIKILSQDDYL